MFRQGSIWGTKEPRFKLLEAAYFKQEAELRGWPGGSRRLPWHFLQAQVCRSSDSGQVPIWLIMFFLPKYPLLFLVDTELLFTSCTKLLCRVAVQLLNSCHIPFHIQSLKHFWMKGSYINIFYCHVLVAFPLSSRLCEVLTIKSRSVLHCISM